MITLGKWAPQLLTECSCSALNTVNKGFECRPRDTLVVSNRFRWLEPSSTVVRRRVDVACGGFYGPFMVLRHLQEGKLREKTPALPRDLLKEASPGRYSLDKHL